MPFAGLSAQPWPASWWGLKDKVRYHQRGKEGNSSEVALPPQITRKGKSEKLESVDLERLCGLCLSVTETPEMLIDTSILE